MSNSLMKLRSNISYYRKCKKSREKAHQIRKKIIAEKGFSVVDNKTKNQIKKYCKSVFGSSSYWPWIAVYTEVRGKFLEGWIPDEYYSYKMLPQLNPGKKSYNSLTKSLEYRIFGEYCIKPLIIIVNNLTYDGNYQIINIEKAKSILNEFDSEVVIKKDAGLSGKAVNFMHSKSIDPGKWLGTGSYIIQPVVKQHESISKIYPHSVNTIRVMTYMDSNSNVNISCIVFRVGSNLSRLDNVATGGRLLALDSNGQSSSHAYNNIGTAFETHHPDTGFCYKDISIPSIDSIKDFCIEAHYKYPYVGIVGWDVYLDEFTKPKLIEWNANHPVFWILEAIVGPMYDVKELLRRIK